MKKYNCTITISDLPLYTKTFRLKFLRMLKIFSLMLCPLIENVYLKALAWKT